MNSDMNNELSSSDKLSRWLEGWKERAKTRSIYFGLLLIGLLILAITLISAVVGFRVAYDDSIINALRLLLILGIGLTYWFFIRKPLSQLDRDYRADELENRFPDLKGELRTYLEESSRKDSNPILGLMAKSLDSKLSSTTPEQLVPQSRINLLKGSFASTAVLLLFLLLASGVNLKFGAQHFLSGWLLPDRLPPQSVVVTPGDSRLKRGSNLTVSAETLGFDSNSATIYAQFGTSSLGSSTLSTGDWDAVPMRNSGDSQYEFSFFGLHDQLNYYVEAAGVRSETHTIEVVDVPGIQAIQITYQYPEWTGLEDRIQQTGTRIQGIEGTEVEIEITSDRPLLDGQLLALDQSIELVVVADAETNVSRAQLTLEETGTYYIADRLDNELIRLTDDYNIAVLTDQAPRVSITLPGADRGASSIEEVPLRVEVQDDFKVDELKLNFSVNAGDWVEIDLPAEEQRIEADYLMMLEDLVVGEIEESGEMERLVPGDLISYFVSAEDHTQEVTSDIYFIDIQPFDKRYSQADGGAGGGGGGGGGGGEDEISERQKEILVATWNLQKEQQNEDVDENYLEDNAFMLSELQRTLAEQTQTTLDRLDARRLVSDPRAQSFAENMEIALEAMQPAADHLLDVELENSVTPQQTALQHLLRAEAQFRDIQVSIDQQNANGGGGAGGGERDLAEIYELEMDMSRNQYETRQTPSLQQPEDAIEDAFDQLEELSRRQEALAEQARRNNELSLSERWEQEQLTREAQELQDQLDQLQQQQQQNGQQGSESQQAATEALQQSLEEIIENMQQAAESAASGQSGQPGSADSASAASEQLQQTLDALNEARQQQFRETIGDLADRSEELQRQQQEAASQLEGALERAMDSRRETGDYISGLDRDQEYDLADLKRDMAEEVSDISETLDNLVDGYSEQLPASSSALRDATEVLDEARLQTRLTEAAEAIEYGLAPQVSVREFVVTDAIDRLRERTEAAAALSEIEMTRDRPDTGPTTAEQLTNLRERLERNLTAGTEGEQQGSQQAEGSQSAEGSPSAEGSQQGQGQQQGEGQQQAAGQGQPTGGQAGSAGGNTAGVVRGGFDDGSNRNLGADFNFTNPATRPLATNTDEISDQATEIAGQLLALSNQLIAEGISDEEIVQAQELARALANQTGDAQRIADSLRALIGQLEKLELGLDLDALSRNNLELNSGSSSSAEDDEDVAEYFRNLSELPVR